MSISPVSAAYNNSLTAGMLQLNAMSGAAALPAAAAKEASASQTFQQFLGAAMDQTVKLQGEADQKTEAFLAGKVDNIHDVMIAGEKADMAFQLTLAVRNKMVDAYTQVMSMQF
jgi:flagellar hook-basal body complex protein FliE